MHRQKEFSVCALRDSTFALDNIREFMETVDRDFKPRFSTYVNIEEYLAKLEKYAEVLLAVCEKTILGVIAFYCNDSTAGISYITYLAVLRNCRGGGVGEKLLVECVHTARRAGMKSVQARTWSGNESAIALYEKIGFQKIRERADRADGSVSAYFELDLNAA